LSYEDNVSFFPLLKKSKLVRRTSVHDTMKKT